MNWAETGTLNAHLWTLQHLLHPAGHWAAIQLVFGRCVVYTHPTKRGCLLLCEHRVCLDWTWELQAHSRMVPAAALHDAPLTAQNVCCRSDLTNWERGCMLCANGTPSPGNPSQRRNKCGSMEALYIYILLHSLLLTWKYTEFFSNCNCTQIKLQNFFFFLTFFPLLCVLISPAFSFFSSFCFFLQSHWR